MNAYRRNCHKKADADIKKGVEPECRCVKDHGAREPCFLDRRSVTRSQKRQQFLQLCRDRRPSYLTCPIKGCTIKIGKNKTSFTDYIKADQLTNPKKTTRSKTTMHSRNGEMWNHFNSHLVEYSRSGKVANMPSRVNFGGVTTKICLRRYA